MKGQVRIGIDFDNTIATYDDVFRNAARAFAKDVDFSNLNKREIRDRLRLHPDGELAWQRMQGFAYGKGISGAKLFEGAGRFLQRCHDYGFVVLIVSHKTEFGHHDADRVNLREVAFGWMQSQGFFRPDSYGILADNVYFEATRQAKLARIATLGCTYFIDDLEEVLSDSEFPPTVTRILFSPNEGDRPAGAYAVCHSWETIEKMVFRD